MIFLKAEIVPLPGMLAELLDTLKTGIFPRMQSEGGWRLRGCFVQQTGAIGTVVDLWELDDYAMFATGNAKLRAHPDYPGIRARLDRCIASETLVFMGAAAGRLAATEN